MTMVLKGRFAEYNSLHLDGLYQVSLKFADPRHINIIDRFYANRHKGIKTRLMTIRDLGIFRQTWDGMVALYVAALFKLL